MYIVVSEAERQTILIAVFCPTQSSIPQSCNIWCLRQKAEREKEGDLYQDYQNTTSVTHSRHSCLSIWWVLIPNISHRPKPPAPVGGQLARLVAQTQRLLYFRLKIKISSFLGPQRAFARTPRYLPSAPSVCSSSIQRPNTARMLYGNKRFRR